jgi:hypothetical protein
MSSAIYPLGMNSMPASGYTHKSTYYNKQYTSWKGTGVNSFPIGTASGHIRPLTNNDPGNVFPTGFGLPRPIKHFRKGRVIPPAPIEGVPDLHANSPYNNNINLTINENALINYNINRSVKSSKGTSLGGGFGGSGLLNDMQDKPGAYIVKLNTINEVDGVTQIDQDCRTCEGVAIVASYKPNNTNLLENPEPNTTNRLLCCNQEKIAKQRVIYASTNLKKNYYTTTKQYLQNRCKTYEQKAFNFLSYKTNENINNTNNTNNTNNPYYYSVDGNNGPKPGGPLALANTYLANCQLNTQLYEGSELAFIYQMLGIMLNEKIITQQQFTEFNNTGINSIQGFFDWIQGLPAGQKESAIVVFEVFINNPYSGIPLSGPTNPAGCQLTVYKPNNYQFAKQGAVSSSTRLLKLNVDTISTNAASIQNYNNTGQQLVTANQLYAGDANNYKNLLKNKAPTCNTPWPLNFPQSGQFQNKKFCHYQKELPEYQNPKSQPSPYRYFPGTVFSSNHYSQSPNTYNTTTGTASY